MAGQIALADKIGQRLRVQAGACIRKAAEDHSGDLRCRRQRTGRRCNGYSGGAVRGETIDTGGNGGKGNRAEAAGLGKFDGAAIA